ncbi:cellulose synthase subunit BcsC-related outer membrane protein [Kozakia baliensis]|uniref:Cellulose synthase operon C C-terminal domain-containing protein n=3 Tax=Kozakia baliensis TaxID=153496 RepID=A0A1D8UYK4_9PROT|nr:cellulose synthase subunit BcsC-related outer membrane protein [Kozakia baliensis]AOX18753.1 hypothetical protein A0U89_15725 [Kozakia baliensis]
MSAQSASPDQQKTVAPNGAARLMLARARYWYERQQFNEARAALAQAQRLSPDDPDVLSLTGEWALSDGRRTEAAQALEKLRTVAPNSDGLNRLVSLMHLHQISPEAVEQARAAARNGDTAGAVQHYQKLFPNGPPPSYALEYYTTLAGVPGERAAAQRGLAHLVTSSPNDIEAQIAYAQSLTWDEASRLSGIHRLQKLETSATVTSPQGERITQILRQAILWLPAIPQNAGPMNDWLQNHPNDSEIVQLRKKALVDNVDPGAMLRLQGFHELDANQLEEASRDFETRLASMPHDADALGGLGIVRLRQHRSAEAVKLLDDAIAADPTHAEHWRQARDGAQVGGAYETVQQLSAEGKYDSAERALAPLIKNAPEQTGPLLLEADLARRARDYSRAISLYRNILSNHKGLATAQEGLIRTLVASGQISEARNALGNATNVDPRLRASIDLVEAEHAGGIDQKIEYLQQAISEDASDPWARLHLAQALLDKGARDQAHDVMMPLIQGGQRLSNEQVQAALFYAGQAEDTDLIERLKPLLSKRAYTPELRALLRRATIREKINNAPSDLVEARIYYMNLLRDGDPDGSLGAIIGEALLDRGDRAGASEVITSLLRREVDPSTDQRLAYAGLYLRMKDITRASQLIRYLQDKDMSPTQATSLQQLRTAVAVTTADSYNARGERAKAYDALAPFLNNDTASTSAARLALARLYQSDGQVAEAYQINSAAVERNPSDLDARLALVQTAVAMRRFDEAQSVVDDMNGISSADPRSWVAAAVLAQARGNWTLAIQFLAQARMLRKQQIGQADADVTFVRNPFRREAIAPDAQASSSDPMLQQIDTRVEDITRTFAPSINITPGIDSRSGSGLNGLSNLSIKGEGKFALGSGRMSLFATPVALNSRKLSEGDSVGRQSIGTTLLYGGEAGERMNATGVALGAIYAWRWLTVDIGSSPLGFQVSNFLGGVEVAPKINANTILRFQLDRRNIADSLLSYSGMRDKSTGATWGGVTRNRFNGQLEYGTDSIELYGRAAVSAITGRNTLSNTEYEAGAGGSVPVYSKDDQLVRMGADLTWFRYDHNEYQFSFGNGGYFSPQSFFALTFPVTYTGHQDQWSWKLGGRIGYQTYHSNASSYYPTNSVLQNEATALSPKNAMLPGQSTSGLTGGADGFLHYQLSPALNLGIDLSYQKAGPWNEVSAFLSAHYNLSEAP